MACNYTYLPKQLEIETTDFTSAIKRSHTCIWEGYNLARECDVIIMSYPFQIFEMNETIFTLKLNVKSRPYTILYSHIINLVRDTRGE